MQKVDYARVTEMIAAECKRQQVGAKEVKQLAAAYEFARMLAIPDAYISVIAIRHMAKLVEPIKAASFRTTPVTFANMNTAIDASLIETALDSLVHAQHYTHPDEFVKEFLDIHPFQDGNGRVAFLLYNIKNNTMHYPDQLPDYFAQP